MEHPAGVVTGADGVGPTVGARIDSAVMSGAESVRDIAQPAEDERGLGGSGGDRGGVGGWRKRFFAAKVFWGCKGAGEATGGRSKQEGIIFSIPVIRDDDDFFAAETEPPPNRARAT